MRGGVGEHLFEKLELSEGEGREEEEEEGEEGEEHGLFCGGRWWLDDSIVRESMERKDRFLKGLSA